MKNKNYRKHHKRNETLCCKAKEPIFPDEVGSKTDNISDDIKLFETVAKRGQKLSIPDLFISRIRNWFSKQKNE